MTAPPALRPMTEAEFQAWRALSVPAYAADKVASGQWTAAEALALSFKEHDELLPQGLATPEHFLHHVLDDDGHSVGMLWFAVKTRFGARVAYVFNIEIDPACRRRGHAQRAFRALEAKALALGLTGIVLHVFGHNHGARALYGQLGFEPTNITMFKPLGQGSEHPPAR